MENNFIFDEDQESLQRDSRMKNINIVRKILIAFISFISPITEIIFNVIMIRAHNSYDSESREYLNISGFIMGMIAVINIITIIIIAIGYYKNKNIIYISIQTIIIIIRLIIYCTNNHFINREDILGPIFILYSAFETLFYCACIIYSVFFLFLKNPIH